MEGKLLPGHRRSNYTVAEKTILLELVNKYRSIIQSKENNGKMILKKREAWKAVTHQYNSVAVSGFRSWKQLRHLYENLKQRYKNKFPNVTELEFYEKLRKELLEQDEKIKASMVENESNQPGNGSYRSNKSHDQDTQLLTMVVPQIQLKSNSYDDPLHFDDTEGKHKIESPSMSITSDTESTCTSYIEQMKYSQEKNIKRQYFRTKLQNARLETKYLINKNKREKNKYKLEMQILKLKLKKLQSLKTME